MTGDLPFATDRPAAAGVPATRVPATSPAAPASTSSASTSPIPAAPIPADTATPTTQAAPADVLTADHERLGMRSVLELDQLGPFTFRGMSRPGPVRMFGGEVAAQALVAAGRTVPADRRVHSLHAYFLRPGAAASQVMYHVDPIRDGGSFTTRRTDAMQNGESIFHLSASFHVPEDGYSHQVPLMDAPQPEELPPAEVTMADADPETREWFLGIRRRVPLDLRFAQMPPRIATMRGEVAPPEQKFWFRTPEPLPDDPLMHSCAATYTSDLFLLGTALPPHRDYFGRPGLQFASLDHAVWFHAPFRADDWLFYDQQGIWAGAGRALCRGRLFDRTGRLVATVMQEGLIRLRTRR